MRTSSPASTGVVAVLVSMTLILGACASGDAGGTGSATSGAIEAPAVPAVPPLRPSLPPPAEPPAPPEPVIQRLFRTLPGVAWDPDQPIRNASFQRLDSGLHREVGQTVRIVEPFELHQVVLWFELATIALPGFRSFPHGTNWDILQNYVQILAPADELPISLSLVLYRSPDPDGFPTARRRTSGFGGVPMRERDVIRVADLELVSEQPLTGRITSLDAPAMLELSEPLLLEPGFWLFGFRIDNGPGDVDLLDLRILGVESGDEIEEKVPAGGRCDYARTPDPYPDGAYYWFDRDPDVFIPAFAKVNECIELGKFDVFQVMNPGDIALDLWGFPVR
jgi:hypothetical protein